MIKRKAMELWFEFSSMHNEFLNGYIYINVKKRFVKSFIKPMNFYPI